MIAAKLNNPTKNATYLSKRIQNELIITMGVYVARKISSEVKKLRLFSVFADETKVRAKVEQVAVGVRYLKAEGKIQERTVKVIGTERLDAVTLTNIINDVVAEINLSWECCTGISFDGASVMYGCRGGVATLLTQVNPHLWYVHCYCHKLNFALVSSCLERQECTDCYVTLKDLHNFFSGSVCAAVLKTANDVRFREYRMRQVDVGEKVQNKIEDSDISENSDNCCVDDIHPIVAGPKELSGKCKQHIAAVTLKSFSKTRWAYQYRANADVRLTFASIVDALTSLSEERGKEDKGKKLITKVHFRILVF